MGCHMQVIIQDKKVIEVSGNTCKRGASYAVDEVTAPKRTLTSTVKTDTHNMLSVKTNTAIPFAKMREVMKELSEITVKVPVKIGDVIISNVCKTGADIVATKNL